MRDITAATLANPQKNDTSTRQADLWLRQSTPGSRCGIPIPGVRERLAAEELVEQWTVLFLSTGGRTSDPNAFKSVERAFHDCLAEKRDTLDPSKKSTKLTIQKIGGIIKPLAPFLKDHGIVYLKDVKTEHPLAFQETWLGRLRKNRQTGELVRQ